MFFSFIQNSMLSRVLFVLQMLIVGVYIMQKITVKCRNNDDIFLHQKTCMPLSGCWYFDSRSFFFFVHSTLFVAFHKPSLMSIICEEWMREKFYNYYRETSVIKLIVQQASHKLILMFLCCLLSLYSSYMSITIKVRAIFYA